MRLKGGEMCKNVSDREGMNVKMSAPFVYMAYVNEIVSEPVIYICTGSCKII